jgi:hypothetical protein
MASGSMPNTVVDHRHHDDGPGAIAPPPINLVRSG